MPDDRISARQLAALHTLYSMYAQRSLDTATGSERESRLAWLSNLCGRRVWSTKELSSAEASAAIDSLQESLGRKPNPFRRVPNKDAARAAGTHGRRRRQENELAIAGSDDLARVNEAITRLGWDQARFDAWLRSPYSPLKGREPKILTVAQANRVWWALKRMLKAAGKWKAA